MNDHITHLALREWEHVNPEKGSLLENRFLDEDPGIGELAERLSGEGMLGIFEMRRGLSVHATSWVGRIRLGSLNITVRPKIQGMALLSLLRYAYKLRNLKMISKIDYETEAGSFQDILISQLVTEVEEIIRRGMHRKYRRMSGYLESPRGRIYIQQIARQGGVYQSSLPCVFHPRLENNLLNQVLLAGLKLAVPLTNDLRLQYDLRRLSRTLLERVSLTNIDTAKLKSLKREMNRLTSAYEPAISIIEIILVSEGISLDPDRPETRLPGFLFDMNRFFQALMSKFLKENLPEHTVCDERRITGMMSYKTGHNPRNRGSPVPRPDFVIMKGGKIQSILDAKYRDLWEKPLPRDMLYQLAIYALSKRPNGEAAILYPTMDTAAREAIIEIKHPATAAGMAAVVMRPVEMDALARLITAPNDVGTNKKRRAFARRLAFGEN